MANYYSLLDIPENASEEDIRKAYRRKAKEYHPDVNKSHDAQVHFVMINKAYEVLIDRQQRFVYDQKNKAAASASEDPFRRYAAWAEEQKARQEAQARREEREFLRRKAQLKESKMYYPYMVLVYMVMIFLICVSLAALVICAFAIVWYHIFMFFFLLPFICLAAYILKFTIDEYRKYKALFA